jgi:hypothetical protein
MSEIVISLKKLWRLHPSFFYVVSSNWQNNPKCPADAEKNHFSNVSLMYRPHYQPTELLPVDKKRRIT